MNIVLSIPSRGRPKELGACLQQWANRASGADGISVVLGVDADDPCADGYYEVLKGMGMDYSTDPGHRQGRTKVEAINDTLKSALAVTWDWDVAICAADDMIPIVDGWDEAIRDTVRQGLDKIYWFDDGRQNIRCTLPVIGREWYDFYGHCYHPSYAAYYCDDEQTQASMERGELVRVMGPMFRHDHACFGAAPNDATYDRNRKYKEADRKIFQVRKQHAWPAETPATHPK